MIRNFEFDKKFDNNEDISSYLDFSKAKKIEEFEKEKFNTKSVNIELPENIINLLEIEAKKVGITTTGLIKIWITQRLQEEQKI